MKIFITGLPYDMDDAELEEFFEKFGTVASAKIAIDRETGKSRGFGFVEMPNAQEGREAIEGLNDISLGKKPLVVKEAEERGPISRDSNHGGPRGGNGAPGGFRRDPNSRPGGGYNNDRNRNNDRDRFRR